MGNNHSAHTKKQNLDALLVRFLPNERESLLETFQHLVKRSGKNQSGTIKVSALQSHWSELPETLREGLVHYLVTLSNKNDKKPQTDAVDETAFVQAVCALTRAGDEEKKSAVYALGRLNDPKNSLRSLISDVVRVGLSSYAKRGLTEKKSALKHLPEDEERLTDYLLLAPLEKGYTGALAGEEEEKAKEEETRRRWLEKSGKSGVGITEDEFTEWWASSPNFLRLLDTWTEDLFFISAVPKATGDVIGVERSREKALAAPSVSILPATTIQPQSRLLSLPDVWLVQGNVPADCRKKWIHVYSSTAGKSWHAFTTAITENGATLILVREAGDRGRVFAGFSTTDWKPKPHFYGTGENFLMSLVPKLKVFHATSYNSNYQYFTFGQATLRNGLQFGGQEGYPGIWIDADFEHGSTRPCTTYGMQDRLSTEEDFLIGEVEAWCLREPERDEDAEAAKKNKRSVLDTHLEAVQMLETSGRRMYSKEVRDADLGMDE